MPKFRVNGVDLNVFYAGHGTPILFVHGFPLDHTMWRAQLDSFALTHHVIAPDLRGFGQSDATAGAVEMREFADDLAALLDVLEVKQPVCFCGLSMGGYVGWQFVRRHASKVGSLIMCDTRAAADTPQAIEGRMKLAQAVIENGPEAAVTAMMPKLLAPSTLKQHPEIVEALRAMIVDTDPESMAAALRGMADRPDMTEFASTLQIPTLLLAGEHDVLTPPSEMRSLSETIKGSTFVEISNAGHMAPMENAEAVNAAIRGFLQD